VFVPNNATGPPLPVVVFLPGGNFRQGAASTLLYDSRYWVRATPFVMVTVNYRLGALGWLVQEDIPRNLGILDQRLALQWVADNAAVFGGDAGRITLMGQSAGATSIGYHLLSSRSVGLFQQVVSESNPLALPLKNPADGRRFGDVFMKHLNCPHGDTACLRNASVPAIVAAQDATNKHFTPLDPLLVSRFLLVVCF
jgi:carboxylesterase type B